VATFGATGYCLGGRYALDLACENVTKAVVLSHPSMVNVPDDFEVRAPLVESCTRVDAVFRRRCSKPSR
jgi:dienelactone hydrolase